MSIQSLRSVCPIFFSLNQSVGQSDRISKNGALYKKGFKKEGDLGCYVKAIYTLTFWSSPVKLSACTHLFWSVWDWFSRTGFRSSPSSVLSSGGLMPARARLVVNRSITLANWKLTCRKTKEVPTTTTACTMRST